MPNLAKLPLTDDEGFFRVVVETPRGETRKIDYDRGLKCFFIKRRMPLGVAYPFNFGFFPSTLGEDGDPLDAIVLSGDAMFPGLSVNCRIAGAVKVEQREKGGKPLRNDRFLAVPKHDFDNMEVHDIADVPKQWRKEIEAFLVESIKLEDKAIKFLGWIGAKESLKLIGEGVTRLHASEKKKTKRR